MITVFWLESNAGPCHLSHIMYTNLIAILLLQGALYSFEMRIVHFCIYRGCGDILMTEQHLNVTKRNAVFKKVRGKRMAQIMRRSLFIDPRPFQRGFQHFLNRPSGKRMVPPLFV